MADLCWKEAIREVQEDSEIASLRAKIEAGNTFKLAVHSEMLYYLSGKDEEVRLRLYVPIELKARILEQYHEKLSHMGIDKICDPIARNYY